MKNKTAVQPAVFPRNQDCPSLSVTAPPISMRADDAARLTGATIFFIEEQMREGVLRFVWLGKRRIIYYSDLLSWAQRQRASQVSQMRASEAA